MRAKQIIGGLFLLAFIAFLSQKLLSGTEDLEERGFLIYLIVVMVVIIVLVVRWVVRR